MQSQPRDYMFSQRGDLPVPGQPGRPLVAARAEVAEDGVDLLRMARTVYDVAHAERPWGFKVAAYLWTKSIAAGVLLVAALAVISGRAIGDDLVGVAAPLISLLFLTATTALLIADLKRPERFFYLLLKPNWRSWLVWGGFILMAFGALAGVWLLAGWTERIWTLNWLAWPAIALAAATAGYSAFLFGQAEGRDFWQSPVVLPHLLVAALAAGSATLLLAAVAGGAGSDAPEGLRLVLLGALGAGALLLGAELWGFHASEDAARAARFLRSGPLALRLLVGVVGAGITLPMLLLAARWPEGWALAALLALAGLWIWEDLWVRAGQAVPLS